MKKELVREIKRLYAEENINIIEYLRNYGGSMENSTEDIMISYDFQAGSYVDAYLKEQPAFDLFMNRLAKEIDMLDCRKHSILECGVGEATTLYSVLKQSATKFAYAGGADISWPRVKRAKMFAEEQHLAVDLFVGDMFNLPLKDNSIDIVFTMHAIEPNGGKEKEILSELYRVTNQYLICVEPAYEFAGKEIRTRMERLGYIKNLSHTAEDLGYKIKKWELYNPDLTPTPQNISEIMIIEKQSESCLPEDPVCCPVTKANIERRNDCFYSSESCLAYPILGEVPCLTAEHAVVATKLKNFCKS